MSAAAWHMALMGSGGVNPLAVQYEDLQYVFFEDNDNVLYEN